jgi:hypothetical protein
MISLDQLERNRSGSSKMYVQMRRREQKRMIERLCREVPKCHGPLDHTEL